MKKLLSLIFLMAITENVNAGAVQDWWIQCNGNSPDSTCLLDYQLSKFKTICSNRALREECRQVVDFTIAQSRMKAGKALLARGAANQAFNYSLNKKYLNVTEQIWDDYSEDKKFSFVVSVLPSCNKGKENKLLLEKNLRPELQQMKNEFLQIYESLGSIPCPDAKEGFVLVAIGKVHDSSFGFEVFTINQKSDLSIIRTAISAGPFVRNLNLANMESK